MTKFDAEVHKAASLAAAHYHVPIAALLAVIETESAGRIYAKVGGRNEPIVRFEGHYFYKRLKGAKLAQAQAQGLASPKAGGVKNSSGQAARWAMIEKAAMIDRKAAYESVSFGIGQVMGAHWKLLGYADVLELVATARSGVGGQLELMMRYIEKTGLLLSLRIMDWKHFALGYNGPKAIENGYHVSLRKNHAKWQKTMLAQEPVVQPRLPEPAEVPMPEERPNPSKPAIPGLDKPLPKSTTFWSAVASFFATVMAAFANLHPAVQFALVAMVAFALIWIIRERRRYADAARKAGV